MTDETAFAATFGKIEYYTFLNYPVCPVYLEVLNLFSIIFLLTSSSKVPQFT